MRTRDVREEVARVVEKLGLPCSTAHRADRNAYGETEIETIHWVPAWCGIVAEALDAGSYQRFKGLEHVLQELKVQDDVPGAIEALFYACEEERYYERLSIIRDFIRTKCVLSVI